jgi:hypothetical protein
VAIESRRSLPADSNLFVKNTMRGLQMPIEHHSLKDEL